MELFASCLIPKVLMS